MKSLVAAIQFLTIFPFPSNLKCEEEHLNRSVPFFSFIGLIIGLVIATFDYGMSFLLPTLPASVIVIILFIGVSGGLHIDGLADTADGFLSSRTKERVLEIMRDSHIGALGVVVVVLVILLKITALASIVGPLRWGTIVLMPMTGRCSFLIQMALLPYARGEGLARAFLKKKIPLQLLGTLIFLSAVAWLLLGKIGLGSVLLSFMAMLIFSWYCRKKIGGLTGDTLGASCELTEIIPALVTASCIHLC